MSEANLALRKTLKQLDASKEKLSAHRVESAIRKALESPPETDVEDVSLRAERMAFAFTANYSNDETGWGTYFGPQIVMQDAQGQWVEAPSLQQVDSAVLEHWEERARSSQHPFLRGRYSDLVWDLSPKVVRSSAKVDMAHLAIDATVEAVEQSLFEYSTDAITQLDRALSLALSISDSSRIAVVRDSMIAFEDSICEDDKHGLWGFSFDALVLNKKVSLDAGKERKLVEDLEARAKRLAEPEGDRMPDAHGVEAAAFRLASYYKKKNLQEDVKRVLRLYGNAFVKAAESAAALVGSVWLKKVYDVFRSHGMKEEADSLDSRLRELGLQSTGEMKTFRQSIEIPNEKMEAFVTAMTEGTFEDAVLRISGHFLPLEADVVEQVRNLAQKAPLQSLFTKTLVHSDGTTVATVGSLEEDLEGHVVQQMSQNLQISRVFLRATLEKLSELFESAHSDMQRFITKAPAFAAERQPIISEGLNAMKEGNHLVAAHLLVPQIEEALRELARLMHRPLYRPGKRGGLNLRNLDDLVRDDAIKAALGTDIVKYLCVVLSDQRGWNLRNLLCHGLLAPSAFGQMTSDRLLHILLVLAHVQKQGAGEGESMEE